MVTIIKKYTGGAYPYYEYACLSTDVKPVNPVPENSICHEIDTGKHYYLANGEWHQLPARGGEGLPDNFPAEGAENANKFLGFDANGNYTAKDAPSGGGAEKFVVELSEDKGEWNTKTSIADIVAADEANQVVVCKLVYEGGGDPPCEIPLSVATDNAVLFGGVSMQDKHVAVVAYGMLDVDGTEWAVQSVELGSTNEPLIVTLTGNGSTLTGDKTYQEVLNARLAGRPVDLVMVGYTCSSVLDVNSGESSISVSFIASGQLVTATGAPNDYVSKSFA